MTDHTTKDCPCCSGKLYTNCCQPFIEGTELPTTPLALMRSRYTAFTLQNIDYIKQTMHGKALLKADLDSTHAWMRETKWLGLAIKEHKDKGPNKGTVHFVASFLQNGQNQQLEEISDFKKIENRWYYVQGRQMQQSTNKEQKIGRNDPCSCGSGKKYKQCCQRG